MRILTGALALFLAAFISVVSDGGAFLPPSTVVAQARPRPTAYQDVYAGWKWWHVYCYRCHGVNAIGGANAPNLISANNKLAPAEFQKIVLRGREEKGMQAWNKLLTAKQIGQIHLYVRARADKVLPPGRPDEVGPKKGPWVPPVGWPSAANTPSRATK